MYPKGGTPPVLAPPTASLDGLFEHPYPNLQNSAGKLFIILLGVTLVFHSLLI